MVVLTRNPGFCRALLCLLLLPAFASPAQAGGYRFAAPRVNHYDPIILSVARSFSIEPALVKAVIAAESSFEPDAISRAGALGLMQLMPETAAELGVGNPFDPIENIEGGTRYLREMLNRYGDKRRALAAYNAGPDAVDRHNGVPPYRETRVYVSRVLKYYRGYRNDIGSPALIRSSKPARNAQRSSASNGRYRPGTEGIEMIRGTIRTWGTRYE